MQYQIELSDGANDSAKAAILSSLKDYNLHRFGPADWKELVIALKDEDGNVIGGLSGHTARGWLYTALLFIPEALRGQGLARSFFKWRKTKPANAAAPAPILTR